MARLRGKRPFFSIFLPPTHSPQGCPVLTYFPAWDCILQVSWKQGLGSSPEHCTSTLLRSHEQTSLLWLPQSTDRDASHRSHEVGVFLWLPEALSRGAQPKLGGWMLMAAVGYNAFSPTTRPFSPCCVIQQASGHVVSPSYVPPLSQSRGVRTWFETSCEEHRATYPKVARGTGIALMNEKSIFC